MGSLKAFEGSADFVQPQLLEQLEFRAFADFAFRICRVTSTKTDPTTASVTRIRSVVGFMVATRARAARTGFGSLQPKKVTALIDNERSKPS